MKKLIASILVFTAIVYSAPSAFAAGDAPSDWAKPEVDKAISVGLVPEELQGKYTDDITRAEFVKLDILFLASLYNVRVDDFFYIYSKTHWDQDGVHPELCTDVFTDTNDSYVNMAYAAGLVTGRGDGIFGPDDPITRQEAAALLLKTYFIYSGGIKHGQKILEFEQLADVGAISDWAYNAAAYMYEWGVLTGVGGNRFDPLGHLTREQCYAALLRFCERAPLAKYPVSPGSFSPLHYAGLIEDIKSQPDYHLLTEFDTALCTVLYGEFQGVPHGPYASLWIVWKDGGRYEVLRELPQDDEALAKSFNLSNLRVVDDTTFRFTRYYADNAVYYQLDLTTGALTILQTPGS